MTFFTDSNNPDQLKTFHAKLYATLYARTGRAADGESMNLGASKFNTLSNIVFGNKNKFGTVLRAPLTVASTCYIVSLFLHRPDGVSEEDVISEARLLRRPDVAASIQASLDQNKTIEAIALERKVKGASTSKTTKNSSGNDQPADSDESRSARTVSKAKDKDKSPPRSFSSQKQEQKFQVQVNCSLFGYQGKDREPQAQAAVRTLSDSAYCSQALPRR